jgi:cyclic pyranopterin phosphate synthase
MPEDEYVWLPRDSILTFEELARVTSIFTRLGVHKLRLTGGEPLLRQDLPTLISLLQRNEAVTDLALTTNGLLLASLAAPLAGAGLTRVTVSLDTLRPDRFQALTRSTRHEDVLRGIAAAADAGLAPLKLNAVIMRGCNEDELVDLIEFGRSAHAQVRFIEYMDVGGATQWSAGRVFSRAEMLATIGAHYGVVTPRLSAIDQAAPAEEFVLPDGTAFGIIASTTAPFCRSCDRSRLTADGVWFLCLYAGGGTDLRQLLRQGASDDEIASVIEHTWRARVDRGAEERAELAVRGALYQIEGLRSDPHREMHTRGG